MVLSKAFPNAKSPRKPRIDADLSPRTAEGWGVLTEVKKGMAGEAGQE